MSKKSAGGSRGPQRARAEAARRMAEQRRAQQRQRAIWVTAIVVVVLLAGGLLGYIYYDQHKPTPTGPTPTVATASQGIPIGKDSAPVTLDLYADFQCPICQNFEKTVGPTIATMIDKGQVKEVFHPVVFLDRESSTQYSTRSSAAFGCVAEYGTQSQYQKFISLLYANQPAEGASGLPDSQLVTYGKQAGITNAKFPGCVNDQTYKGWSTKVTDAATKRGVNATPTVYLNGTELSRNDYSVAGVKAQVAKLVSASK